MIKHLLFIVILSFVFSLAPVKQVKGQAAIVAFLFGDQVASEKFNISMEAGGVFTHYSDIPDTKRSRMGINFGIGANLQLAENWYFSPQIYFLGTRNVRFKTYSLDTGKPGLDDEFMNVPATLDLRYNEIPILFSYQTNNNKFRFSLGPQISFLRKANAIFNGEDGDFKEDFDSYVNKVDYGPVADACYLLGKAMKGRGIFVHARYYYGLADIFNDKLSTDFNRMGYFSLHLSLPFITDELAAKNLEK
ncbi:porin family protein [Maribellus sediminis]|uniref:porin family protein n=1 Tax=Maribellus sediminis TaxID=2696285 RepID=UPI00142FB427|nr:porin family protein [Maribellus sediminis]